MTLVEVVLYGFAAGFSVGLPALLYAHPDDRPAIKALAEKLQRKRAKR